MLKYVLLASLLSLPSFTLVAQPLPYEQLIKEYITWAKETDKKGLIKGQALTPEQVLLARDVGVQQPEKIRIIYSDAVPFPYQNKALKALGEQLGLIGEQVTNNAQVFGYSIYVRNGYQLDRPKLAHEFVHVLQIERASLDQVVIQHLQDMAKYDYQNAPLEVEAFKANIKYK